MTVYVDNMLRSAQVGRGRPAKWSHLMADTTEELEEFARQLGLRPSWIQHPGTAREHYDVTATVRAEALRLGAVPMTYGRKGGLFTLLKAARMRGDVDEIADYEQRLADERARIAAGTS